MGSGVEQHKSVASGTYVEVQLPLRRDYSGNGLYFTLRGAPLRAQLHACMSAVRKYAQCPFSAAQTRKKKLSSTSASTCKD